MVIYLDLLFFINFLFDFFLLLTVNLALKRYTKIYRLVLASFFGEITLISLFYPLSSVLLTILKLFLGLFMVLIAFGYQNILYTFYNLLYLYMTSIILGGFIYYLKTEFHINNNLYYKGISLSYLFLLCLAPIIFFIFLKSLKALQKIKNYYYKVTIVINNNYTLTTTGFLDTGNKLKDPITNKPIILLNKKLLKENIHIRSPMLVPIDTVNSHSLITCFKPQKIYLNTRELKNYLVGLSEKSFKLNGVGCLLNYQILEEIND